MPSFSTFSVAALAASAISITSADPTSCCAFGGNGAGILTGTGTINIQEGSTSVYSITLAINPSPSGPGAAVLIGDDSSNPKAGWIITQNATGQTMQLWYNNTEGETPICHEAYTELSSPYMSGFLLCPGVEGSLFTTFLSSYILDGVGSGFPFNVYSQTPGGTLATFTSSDNGCAPLSIIAPASPLGGGAFSFSISGGNASQPPSSMFTAPAVCQF